MTKHLSPLILVSIILLVGLLVGCLPQDEPVAEPAPVAAVTETAAVEDSGGRPKLNTSTPTPTNTPTSTPTNTPTPIPTNTATSTPLPTIPPTMTPRPPATFTPRPPTPPPPPPPSPTPVLGLNPSLPEATTVSLSAGFTPDPYSGPVTSGGSVDVASLGLGSGCTGYAIEAPDYELHWSGTSSELRIFFAADNGGDTTIIINDPNGNWRCNDDFEGVDPGIIFNNPAQGIYDIWVGSYSRNQYVNGRLYITELDLGPANPQPEPEPSPPSGSLNPSLSPNFGSVSLTAGFLPDPHEVGITSGGSVDVASLGLGSGCTGYATSAPDYRLHWSGSSSDITIYFTAGDGRDTTLIVNDPNGNWRCNDDYSGLNPAVVFSSPASGQYDIWVGSYAQSTNVSGTLAISEFDPFTALGGSRLVMANWLLNLFASLPLTNAS